MLTHHGALCNQWVTVPGKMKQHYRLSHYATHEEFAHPAAKLCSRFNTSGSPCEHCGAVTKAPRQHPSKCTVLWQLCVLHLRNHGYFGALLQKYGDAVLKEEPGEDTTREAKAPKLEGGKGSGRPHSEPRRGQQPKGGPPAQGLSQVVKALARLALQQETSIKVLRQYTTWIIFLQPGPMSSLSLLFQVGQQWKQNQQRGAVDRSLRSVLIMCLLEHLH